MPKVGKKHFAYTKAGHAAADKERRKKNIKGGKAKRLTKAARAKVKETPPVGLPAEVNPTTAPPPETRRRPAPERRERIEPIKRPLREGPQMGFIEMPERIKFKRYKPMKEDFWRPLEDFYRDRDREFKKKAVGGGGRRKRLQKAATTELMGGPKTREGARWMEERE